MGSGMPSRERNQCMTNMGGGSTSAKTHLEVEASDGMDEDSMDAIGGIVKHLCVGHESLAYATELARVDKRVMDHGFLQLTSSMC